jgi:hypothetical protein
MKPTGSPGAEWIMTKFMQIIASSNGIAIRIRLIMYPIKAYQIRTSKKEKREKRGNYAFPGFTLVRSSCVLTCRVLRQLR